MDPGGVCTHGIPNPEKQRELEQIVTHFMNGGMVPLFPGWVRVSVWILTVATWIDFLSSRPVLGGLWGFILVVAMGGVLAFVNDARVERPFPKMKHWITNAPTQ